MHFPSLLVIPDTLQVTTLRFDAGTMTVHAKTTGDTAACPSCGYVSHRLHSRYTRTLADLPWVEMPVRCQVLVRRFRCDNRHCPQQIFAERLDELAETYARRTIRQHTALVAIAFALGGEAGARLADTLRIPVSADTLLRYIRHAPEPVRPPPQVLGVDEWAWRKGHRYGAILVDLERHRVVDLLPDRSAASFASWLHTHPETEIISRDRGGAYVDGARQGAPAARQVADRFHLLQNLGDAVEKVLQRYTSLVQRIPRPGAVERAPPPRRDREAARARTQKKTAQRYATIQALNATGMSQRAIARALGWHRDTVRRYVEAETVPERPRSASRAGILTPYEGYLQERWRQGERNGMTLWREIVALGYPGKRGNVARFIAELRRQEEAGVEWSAPACGLTPRQAVGLLLVRPAARSREHQETLGQLADLDPEIGATLALVDRFAQMLRDRTSEALDQWLDDARDSGIPEMIRFVTKLRQDLDAVQAALSTQWSQGQVEGQITKLKLIRRQMYGRGKFDLVRKRVLNAA